MFFYIYKKSLKRFYQMQWFDAHFAALLSVTPRHGRSYFSRCNVPACHGYENLDVADDEGVNAALVAVICLHVTNTAIINSIAVFLIMLKFKKLI